MSASASGNLRPAWFTDGMNALLRRESPGAETLTAALRAMVAGRAEVIHAAAFLIALRLKGETAAEIAIGATVLREQMQRLVPVSGPVLDTCGTGGDDAGTFNISTAAAFVVAGAGVPVVKHGNRAVSSHSGSADCLVALGVNIEQGAAWAQRCLDRAGFAFCFAPHFHPGMAHVAKLRRTLGLRTLFNLLGPLANPAAADYQLLGVGQPSLLDPLAGAIARLGTRRAVLVHSDDGLDEVSLAAPTQVRVVEGDMFAMRTWQPSDFGLAPVALSDISADGPVQSAAIVEALLQNQDTPHRRIVLANAAAALYAAEQVTTLRDGVARAEASLNSGKARSVLEQLRGMR
ncbi:MAG: anthranilate phosphoribosyltransferase [Gemmataceae bacterium]